MRKLIQNATLVVISVLFAFLVLEATSRFFLRTAYTHVVNDRNKIVSMQIDPGNPSKGLKPNFSGRIVSPEFDVSIQLDSLGFRKRIICGNLSFPESLHVTLLGDSFMFGWGVEYHESYAFYFANYLSDLLRKKVVLTSLAIPATGQYSQYSSLNRIQHPKPDIVLAGMYLTDHIASGNDLIENLQESYTLEQKVAATEPQTAKPDMPRQIRRWLKNHSNLFRYVETRITAILLAKFSNAIRIKSDSTLMEKAWMKTGSILDSLQRKSKDLNALFVIQYVPNMLDVAQNKTRTYTRLDSICTSQNTLLAPNPLEYFYTKDGKPNIGDFYYLSDGHWQANAHRIAAETTAEMVAKSYLLKLE